MENKEVRDWRDRQALKRLEMIAPLMDPDMDDAKRCQMREEIAGKNGLTVRSLYRYEKYYREGSFEGGGAARCGKAFDAPKIFI